MNKTMIALLITGTLSVGTVGCASHTGEGALIGGATGAALGAAIGSTSHQRVGEGALLGAAIGAIGGGLIGNEADRQEKEHASYGSPPPPPQVQPAPVPAPQPGGFEVRADYGYGPRYEPYEVRYERPRYVRRYYRPRPVCSGGYYEYHTHHYGAGGRRVYERTYYHYD
jgi:hypothetical protein